MMKPNRKRKADALGRLAEASSSAASPPPLSSSATTKLTGRGSLDGWTSCPLCGKYSKKKYALGRGISAHLHSIHTPWNPTKLSLKIARRQREEQERSTRQNQSAKRQKNANDKPNRTVSWEPTQCDMDAWDDQVLKILSQVEAKESDTSLDRTGKPTRLYRDSLPEFLVAAAEGDLEKLMEQVEYKKQDLMQLLNTTDRHLSTAEHWAAGGGHVECLKYLLELRQQQQQPSLHDHETRKTTTATTTTTTTVRRRDGKTCLHYAARNGFLNCVEYLIEEAKFAIDEASGEGTTPFHMACYGGHLHVVQYLSKKGANVHATNDWGCDAFQFVGLTISSNSSMMKDLCNYLQHDLSINLVRSQKQGHSILHKAAQKGNLHVIQWVAKGAGLSKDEKIQIGAADAGGYTPSQIWRKFNDDTKISTWMESLGW